MNTRRRFLIQAPLAALVGTATWKQALTAQTPSPTPTTAGAPPTFGTGPGSGPPVTPQTFAETEKLMQVTMTALQRQQAADTWRTSLAVSRTDAGPGGQACDLCDSFPLLAQVGPRGMLR